MCGFSGQVVISHGVKFWGVMVKGVRVEGVEGRSLTTSMAGAEGQKGPAAARDAAAGGRCGVPSGVGRMRFAPGMPSKQPYTDA